MRPEGDAGKQVADNRRQTEPVGYVAEDKRDAEPAGKGDDESKLFHAP
jgi:hypothetical protein